MSHTFNGPPYRGGGRGRGRGGGRGGGGGGGRGVVYRAETETEVGGAPRGARTQYELAAILKGINNRTYGKEILSSAFWSNLLIEYWPILGQYKSLLGSYTCSHPTEDIEYMLFVDKVQSDSYAAPSHFRVKISTSIAGIPKDVYDTRIAKIAFCDLVTRQVKHVIQSRGLDVAQDGGGWSGPKGGDFGINAPSQQVIERTSCIIQQTPQTDIIELRFTLNLPAQGRTILGYAATELITIQVPALVEKGLLWKSFNPDKVWEHIRSVQVQESLRNALKENNLVAFIGNDSILPRVSGASPLPMEKGKSIAFKSPETLKTRIETGVPDKAGSMITIEGMGIPRGVTILTGGGFHGKTTLLEALELGIYNVRPGDGRELVVTDPNAFKIRAEDGRNVVGTDISPFINNLPGLHGPTTSFTSEDASGSTSMAANIQEAIEIGATTLLIDEDTSATNFLVRDKRMQELIKAEPISPFVSKARALFEKHGVSTIIIIGGCGDYLTIADTVIGMDSYKAFDITSRAREVIEQYPVAVDQDPNYGTIPKRIPILPDFHKIGKPPRGLGIRAIQVGDRETATVDLSGIDQLVEDGQAQVCAEVLRYISKSGFRYPVEQWAVLLKRLVDAEGLDALHGEGAVSGKLVRVRELEILCAVNRVRGLTVA